MIPGKMTVTLQSPSTALQSQLQQILDIASGKTLKLAATNQGILDFSEWVKFVEALNSRPVFRLVRDEGDVIDRYEYAIAFSLE